MRVVLRDGLGASITPGLLIVLCSHLKGTPDIKLFSKPMALSLLCKYLLKAFVSSVSLEKIKNPARSESLSFFSRVAVVV